MRKVLQTLFAAALIALCGLASAQVARVYGTITTQNLVPTGACTAGGCVEIDMTNRGTVTVQVTDTYTGALSGQVSTDGTTWITLAPTPFTPATATGTPTATIASAATGAWQVSAAAGYLKFRLTALAAVTGGAKVTLQSSVASIGSSAGGGTDGVAQGSATSGQSGPLVQCAVTTGAPTYTTAQTSPISCDTSGNVRVVGGAGGTSSSFGAAVPATGTAAGLSDGTNMVLPRSFDADSGAGTQNVAGVSLRKAASGGSVEAGTSTDPIRVDPTGTTTQPVSATALTNLDGDVGAAADSVCATDTGTCSLIALAKRQNQNITSDPNYTQATGSAVPTRAVYMAGRTGANAAAVPISDTTAKIDVATATTALVVALTASQKIWVGAFSILAGGTGNIKFVYGTQTTNPCDTGATDLTGNYNLTAQNGIAQGSGLGAVLVVPAGQQLCVTTSAAVQMSGHVTYTKF